MRAFVTGATGFLGSHLTELLVRNGADVAVLLRKSSDTWRIAEVLPKLHRIDGDLSSLAVSSKEIEAFGPNVVFHVGWAGVGAEHRNNEEQIEQNVIGSVGLARLAKKMGCHAFIGLGSQAEYGPCTDVITENTATNPTTLYGAAKLSVYHLTRVTLRDSGVRFAWLRLFSAYGPKDNPGWMIPYLISTLLAGECPRLTAGEQQWDYIYVHDAVNAIYQTAITQSASGVFNLGSGNAIRLRAVIESIRDMVNPSLPLGLGQLPYRSDQVMRLQADITRLNSTTGWIPQVTLEAGLQKTVEWYTRRETM